MRHRRGGSKLGRLTAHRWALFRNLLTALFTHERITTTLAKAKAVRPLADHLVTLAKEDNPTRAGRPWPWCRTWRSCTGSSTRSGPATATAGAGTPGSSRWGRGAGDGAPLAILELVDRPEVPKEKSTKGKKSGRAEGQRGEEGAEGGGRRGRG